MSKVQKPIEKKENQIEYYDISHYFKLTSEQNLESSPLCIKFKLNQSSKLYTADILHSRKLSPHQWLSFSNSYFSEILGKASKLHVYGKKDWSCELKRKNTTSLRVFTIFGSATLLLFLYIFSSISEIFWPFIIVLYSFFLLILFFCREEKLASSVEGRLLQSKYRIKNFFYKENLKLGKDRNWEWECGSHAILVYFRHKKWKDEVKPTN